MPYQYIEAVSDEEIKNPQSLFLAGGITKCSDWQAILNNEFSDMDRFTVINPRRKDFDVSKKEESVKQIGWEFKRLREVSQVLFWFAEETVQPITLYELGATLERNKNGGGQKVFIGVDPDYERIFDVKVQARLQEYSDNIATSLEELAAMVKIYNKNLESFKGEE